MSEFGLIELIQSHFAHSNDGVILGIGDDAALINIPAQQSLAISTDTLNEGKHFFPDCEPEKLGHKALAVNLSDLAAMGAVPRWFLLNLSLPSSDRLWVKRFLEGMDSLVREHHIALVGGDTCEGPLSVTVTALGTTEPANALTRSGARKGDLVCVSGTLGDAALAVKLRNAGKLPEQALMAALELPSPRVKLGQSLRGLATSCIDISDGLCADLSHIAEQSGCGAIIHLERIPCSDALAGLQRDERIHLQLTGGDDYELCFTIPVEKQDQLCALSEQIGLPISTVGSITAGGGVTCIGAEGEAVELRKKGYSHFSD